MSPLKEFSTENALVYTVCTICYHESGIVLFRACKIATKGAQWLSGRVLDSRPRGRGFEPHRRHCVVVIEQDTFILA